MKLETSAWDASEYLESEEDIAAYLTAIMEEGDPALLQAGAWRYCQGAGDDRDCERGQRGSRKLVQVPFRNRQPIFSDHRQGRGIAGPGNRL